MARSGRFSGEDPAEEGEVAPGGMATASPAACQRQLTATALLVATVCACVTLTVLILLLERAGLVVLAS